ncbi:MAG: MBL fold metallo-hydrolase [Chloroflexi bacterium]|nr:MAG: MBL fold metallo-hydrolase [Chloroflexota bacterium]
MTIDVNFLDVGQGDTTIIVLPDKQSAIVVDCFTNAAQEFIEINRINSVPFTILTHSDYDHCSHIVSLIQNHLDTTFVFSPDSLKLIQDHTEQRKILRRLAKLIEKHDLQILGAIAGTSIGLQDVQIDVLHPSEADMIVALSKGKTGNTNDASTLLRVTYADKRVLLTGDLGKKGWAAVVKRGVDLSADILKFPHHGAYFKATGNGSLQSILNAINPVFAAISVGTKNTYNHPRNEVLAILDAQKIHYRCTQATPNCYPGLVVSEQLKCAGTMGVQISETGITTSFDNPVGVCGRVTAKYL